MQQSSLHKHKSIGIDKYITTSGTFQYAIVGYLMIPNHLSLNLLIVILLHNKDIIPIANRKPHTDKECLYMLTSLWKWRKLFVNFPVPEIDVGNEVDEYSNVVCFMSLVYVNLNSNVITTLQKTK